MDAFTRAELETLIARSTLPGVDPTEVRVLREFLRRQGSNYSEYRFNVRVGEGVQLEGAYSEKFREDWARRTKMRLDLVCFSPPNFSTLIEAKVQWANDAVWQLLGYRDHYAIDFPRDEIKLAGVAEAYTPTARTLASSRGIRLFVYGFPPELPASPATSVEEA